MKQVIVITGASSGFGALSARALELDVVSTPSVEAAIGAAESAPIWIRHPPVQPVLTRPLPGQLLSLVVHPETAGKRTLHERGTAGRRSLFRPSKSGRQSAGFPKQFVALSTLRCC
jgi:hypothetical protein